MSVFRQVILDSMNMTPNSALLRHYSNSGRALAFTYQHGWRNTAAYAAPEVRLTNTPIPPIRPTDYLEYDTVRGVLGDWHDNRNVSVIRKGRVRLTASDPHLLDTASPAYEDPIGKSLRPYRNGLVTHLVETSSAVELGFAAKGDIARHDGTAWRPVGNLTDLSGITTLGTITVTSAAVTGNGSANDITVFTSSLSDGFTGSGNPGNQIILKGSVWRSNGSAWQSDATLLDLQLVSSIADINGVSSASDFNGLSSPSEADIAIFTSAVASGLNNYEQEAHQGTDPNGGFGEVIDYYYNVRQPLQSYYLVNINFPVN